MGQSIESGARQRHRRSRRRRHWRLLRRVLTLLMLFLVLVLLVDLIEYRPQVPFELNPPRIAAQKQRNPTPIVPAPMRAPSAEGPDILPEIHPRF